MWLQCSKIWPYLVALLLIFICLPRDSKQSPAERRLLRDLLIDYDPQERPVANHSEPIIISFSVTLQQIIDVVEKNQQIISNIWLTLEWIDVNLKWEKSEYDGIEDLRIQPHRIWKPDVLMYNSADEKFDGTYHTNLIVRNNGSILWVPPGIFKSTCKIDITWFPFDEQNCELKFGSWTYDGASLDLRLKDDTGGDIQAYITNGEWTLLGFPAKRNEYLYTCCPNPYIDVVFTINIRRRTLYYGFNLIIPCVLISSMSLLGFTLPPDSGEKLTLGVTILLSLMVFLQLVAETMPNTSEAVSLIGVTILLSMTVFLLIVAETMPPTSDALPLIGTYFACIMIMVAFSVVMTVVVLNYHHRSAETHKMPGWVKTLLLQWLPWILWMDRPGKKITRQSITFNAKLKELEMKERSSKSLLANVLDIDDDFRQLNNAQNLGNSGSNCAYLRVPPPASMEDSSPPVNPAFTSQPELAAILREIRYMTNQMREKDMADEVASDWKFAAMVVDRLCLILFSAFTVVSTCVCILRAEHLTT